MGEYHLVFDNSKGSSSKIITFAIDITNAKKGIHKTINLDQIVKEDLDPLDADLMEIHQQLNVSFFSMEGYLFWTPFCLEKIRFWSQIDEGHQYEDYVFHYSWNCNDPHCDILADLVH